MSNSCMFMFMQRHLLLALDVLLPPSASTRRPCICSFEPFTAHARHAANSGRHVLQALGSVTYECRLPRPCLCLHRWGGAVRSWTCLQNSGGLARNVQTAKLRRSGIRHAAGPCAV